MHTCLHWMEFNRLWILISVLCDTKQGHFIVKPDKRQLRVHVTNNSESPNCLRYQHCPNHCTKENRHLFFLIEKKKWFVIVFRCHRYFIWFTIYILDSVKTKWTVIPKQVLLKIRWSVNWQIKNGCVLCLRHEKYWIIFQLNFLLKNILEIFLMKRKETHLA